MRPLDCGGCRRCCEGGDLILLQPGDNPLAYETSIHGQGLALKRGPDGRCVYLGAHGCKIHGRAPKVCQTYDCRIHAVMAALNPQAADAAYARDGVESALGEGIRRLARERKLSGQEERLRRRFCTK